MHSSTVVMQKKYTNKEKICSITICVKMGSNTTLNIKENEKLHKRNQYKIK